ncbi:MAG: class I SAM-dependent methyltransferase [Chitinophagaceae bacterium]|nr:class I SAM-dependent methyltransferase [Chitinophagaceae bacterium]
MDESIKCLNQVTFDEHSNDYLLRHAATPLRKYEEEFIEGPIIEIGCGQSALLLDYANTDREIYAIDNDQFQLDLLKKRVEKLEKKKIENWKFLNLTFPEDIIPSNHYSVIILSNILHFFNFKKNVEIGKIIDGLAMPGTLIYIAVHSTKFYGNNSSDPNRYQYFKHYFKLKDFDYIFPKQQYLRVFTSEYEQGTSKATLKLIDTWLDRFYEQRGITDPETIELDKKEYLQNINEAGIHLVLRKIR